MKPALKPLLLKPGRHTSRRARPTKFNNNLRSGVTKLTMNNNAAKQRSNVPSLVCALMASLTTGGTTYAFGLYGASLKRSLQLSQGELDTISTAFFVAGLFSWIPGSCADRFGTRFSMSLGGVLGASFLLSYWSVARQFILVPRELLVPLLSILGVAIFLSNALITGSVFKIIVSSCGPGSKGSAVGVAKGYVGLGAGAYASIFGSIRQPGESDLDFLPMAAFFAIAVVTIPGLIILPSKRDVTAQPAKDETTPLHFKTLYGSLLCMAIIIIGNCMLSLLQEQTAAAAAAGQNRSGADYAMAFIMVTIWLGPICALFYLPRQTLEDYVVSEVEVTETHRDVNRQLDTSTIDDHPDSLTKELRITTRSDSKCSDVDQGTEDVVVGMSSSGSTSNINNNLDRGEDELHLLHDNESGERYESSRPIEDKNLIEMLRTPSAFLILWTTTILVGAGTVETNNMGQMVEALRFSDSVTPASLALFSVAQAGARVATGALSEVALGWKTRSCGVDKGIPRPFFLVVASVVAFFAHLTLVLAHSQAFFLIGVVMSGVAFGMIWPLMVLITGEIFGSAHVGANYMFFDGFTSALGTLLISKVLAQKVYEDHINEESPDPFTCIGKACFAETHLIICSLALSCIGTSLATQYTSRHAYNRKNRVR